MYNRDYLILTICEIEMLPKILWKTMDRFTLY